MAGVLGIASNFKVKRQGNGNNLLKESSIGFVLCFNEDRSNYYIAAFNYIHGESFSLTKLAGNVPNYHQANDWGTLVFNSEYAINNFNVIYV